MALEDVDHILTTTRSVRKRLDLTRSVEPEVIQECLEIAIQAPTGANIPQYYFIVVTDADRRARLADIYRKAFDDMFREENLEDYRRRDVDSWMFLYDNLHKVPVHIIPCAEGRPEGRSPERLAALYGNVLPAAWSLMLALRARGLGAAWTSVHIAYEEEAKSLLGIPKTVTQGGLLPVGYFMGSDFKPANRPSARERTYWNTWNNKL
ncbi:MAG: nitroreductase family protein [Gammaproteobacteria bacterium]|nr:nitroreductase family protein [Gammaproteobacteria bacterium]MDX2462132.1 nitroreductase family protein [Gammaproteobacteria bacterium]